MTISHKKIEKIINLYKENSIVEINNIKKANYSTIQKDLILNHFTKSFLEYKIIDWTNEENIDCIDFKILMHNNQDILDDDIILIKRLGGTRKDLRVFVSLLDKFYTLFYDYSFINEINNNWTFKREYIESSIVQSFEFYKEMEMLGYTFIEDQILNKKIVDVETEVIEKGEVKLFNLLFTDMVKY
ncbi:hypothetical protein ACQKP0_12115 [Heyndrickxia sp. NPDC080065]|uniref:hypothetical protein n=1 Tax=Heyndrickxia sp. NPDC080065 TaxID=3390568 RepID=UPI003D0740E5